MTGRNVVFAEAVTLGFRNYFNFRDRAQRAEYWWWTLFTVLGGFVLGLVELALGLSDAAPLSTVFNLATIIPTLSVAARRLHDIGRSGWWQLLPVVPLLLAVVFFAYAFSVSGTGTLGLVLGGVGVLGFVGTTILLLVWLVTDSERTPNRFGPSPKYGSDALVFD